MATRYVHDYEAFGRRVLQSEAMQAAMRARAERVAEVFRATAPVGEPYEDDKHAGRFRDSAVVSHGTETIERGERAYGRVTVTDPAALSIEFGFHPLRDERGRFRTAAEEEAAAGNSSDADDEDEEKKAAEYIPGHHTLTRALDAAGDT